MEQLMEVRLVVDPLAVRLAAEEADDDDLRRIRGSVERQRKRDVLESHEEWFRENLYFHWAIAAASHNPLVRVLSESLHNIVLAGGIQIDFKASERRRSIDDHAAIYECLEARDGDGAALRLQRHLERSLYLRARYSGDAR
jgi:DNA-binding FadR family transcriptional regulator